MRVQILLMAYYFLFNSKLEQVKTAVIGEATSGESAPQSNGGHLFEWNL